MTDKYVSSTKTGGGDTGADKTNAYLTLEQALASTVAGDIIYVDTLHTQTDAASDFDLTADPAGASAIIVVQDWTDDSYDPNGATENIITTTGSYEIDITRGVCIYGMRFKSNEHISTGGDTDAPQKYVDCTFTIGVDDYFGKIQVGTTFVNATVKTQDVSDSSSVSFFVDNDAVLIGCTLSTGFEYRESLFSCGYSNLKVLNSDLSAAVRNPTALSVNLGNIMIANTKLPPNYVVDSGTDKIHSTILSRCNDTDDFEAHYQNGSMISEATIVRTGGATKSWEMISNAYCGPNTPVYTGWIYGIVDATGSTNFDVHIAYSGTRLTKEEVFLEVELIDSASQPYGDRYTSQERAILGDAVGNLATASETWGGSETYEEYIRVVASVGVAGTAFRARVGIEKTSQVDEVYVDAKVETS